MSLEKFVEVYEFAKKAHEGQYRRSGEPYITHPVAVASIASDNGADEDVIHACLLHDVVEDTQISLEEVKRRFGDSVAFLVDSVTKAENPEATLAKIKRYSEKDKRVILVKLSDRIHNILTFNEAEFGDKKERYVEVTRWYIELGRANGYSHLADKLENFTNKLK